MLNPIFIKYVEALNAPANSQLALCRKAARLAISHRYKDDVAAGVSLDVKLNVAAAIFTFGDGKELKIAVESSGERANLNGHSERRALAILINQAITQKIVPFSSLRLIENTRNPSAETFDRYKEALSTVKSITIFTERAPCTIKVDKPTPDVSAAAASSSSSKSKSESEDNCHTFLDKLFINKENLKVYYSVKLNLRHVMEADLSAQMQEAKNIISPSQSLTSLNAAAALPGLGSSSASSHTLTEEEKARIEKNRLAALERRAQRQAAEAAKVASFVPPTSSLASSAASAAASLPSPGAVNDNPNQKKRSLAGSILKFMKDKFKKTSSEEKTKADEESPRSKSSNVAMSSPAVSSDSEDDLPRPASAALTSSAASVLKAFEQGHASFPDSSSTTASSFASAGHVQTPALQLHIIQEQEKAKQEAQGAEQAAAAAKQVAKKQDSPPSRPPSR